MPHRSLFIALAVLVAGLCGVCLFQWRREAGLRAAIHDFSAKLGAETAARGDAEKRVATLEAEVTRLSGLRDELEEKFQAASAALREISADSLSRGHTILALANLAVAPAAADTVAAQNDAIRTQNDRLRELAAERDDAIRRLNARTREYNDLVRKVNAGRRND